MRLVLKILSIIYFVVFIGQSIFSQNQEIEPSDSNVSSQMMERDTIALYLKKIETDLVEIRAEYKTLADAFRWYKVLEDSVKMMSSQLASKRIIVDSLNKELEARKNEISKIMNDLENSRNKTTTEKNLRVQFLESMISLIIKSGTNISLDILNTLSNETKTLSVRNKQDLEEFRRLYDTLSLARIILDKVYEESEINSRIASLEKILEDKNKYPGLAKEAEELIVLIGEYEKLTCFFVGMVKFSYTADTEQRRAASVLKERWRFVDYPYLLREWGNLYVNSNYRLPMNIECN